MRTPGHLRTRSTLPAAVLAVALAIALAGPSAPAAPADEGGWTPFEATWSAAGQRRALKVGPREAAVTHLSGSLVVSRGEGLRKGFRAEAITYDDGAGEGLGAMVLTDDRGDQVFSSLKGSTSGKERSVLGTITGGTGRYAGITGDLSFRWQQLLLTADGEIQGFATGLKGRFRVPAPPPSSPGAPR